MIGNFYIEAGLKPNNVEDSSGFDDETYTKNVDNGTYSKESFVNDGAGYGLAQWTYSSRKKALYEYAKEKGTSIGDLNMQMEFLWKEMNSTHKSGLNYMKQNGDKSVDSLTEYFCWEFENPGVPHMNERKRYANDIYEKYKNNHNNSNNKCSHLYSQALITFRNRYSRNLLVFSYIFFFISCFDLIQSRYFQDFSSQ